LIILRVHASEIRMRTTRRLLALFLAALPLACVAAESGAPQPLLVYAAVSLSDSLGEAGRRFEARGGARVKFSFAASSTLARQIEAGADADMFASADLAWMDYLQARRLIRPGTRRNALGNRLVLIAPADSRVALKIAPKFALAAALGRSRLTTGDPDTVPAGRYARAALTSLGVWDGVAGRLVRADSVRNALGFVARGDAALGIVYATDAAIDPRVRVVDTFPAASHPPIVYPFAVTARGGPDAVKFLEFLRGPETAAIFERHGFIVLD
jgi:molybdate transport system substrate-binding protein